MLLADYLLQHNLLTGDEQRDPYALDLTRIDRFKFGDRYLIELASGKNYDIADLEDMLAIVHGEYTQWARRFWPSVEVFNRIAGKQIKPELHVKRQVKVADFLPTPQLDLTIETIRRSVTMFNLSGEMRIVT